MRHFDLTPLYRSTVGFDRLFNMIDGNLAALDAGAAYPPYNIERTGDNAYRVTMAVAGFGDSEIDVSLKEQTLTIKGQKTEEKDEKRDYLHRGIASRAFERKFQLADYVEVKGASLENGLLHIDLAREIPEAMKPRQIAISSKGAEQKVIEG